MDGTKGFQDLLGNLRQTFNQRIPGGLTDVADARLNRTLNHYICEVERVRGPVQSESHQDILRMTYDSMAKWFRRNLIPRSPDPVNMFESEVDPLTLFADIKKSRQSAESIHFSGANSESRLLPSTTQSADPIQPKASPTAAPDYTPLAQEPRPTSVQQKDVLQPQENVVKYREVEYNLIMNSKDRDWLQNTTQNRYNFSIQFNTNYKPQGYGFQAGINVRLRNVVRIEFVKAILPVEGLDVIVPRDCSGEHFPQNAFSSALALPSVNVLLDEIDGNNFGTSNAVDRSFAVCQYDATWRSETAHHKPGINRGYSLFFPKFMKAQRVYSPTPLANLQTLSFRLQDPEDNLLSTLPDSSMIATIAFGNRYTGISGESCYLDNSGEYIFLRSSSWFSIWSYSQMDKILLQGLTPIDGTGLTTWLEDPAGHSVLGVAYSTSTTQLFTTINDGCNSAGYANWIILRNRFVSPTTGLTALDPFSADDDLLGVDLLSIAQTGGALNLSRQVQLVIRLITREYDLISSVRAENV